MGSRTPQLGQDPARDRPKAKRTVWLCGPAVALDRRANLCVAGPLATAQGRLRVLAGNHRGAHSHCDDSAHASKIGTDLTFSNALRPARAHEVLQSFYSSHPRVRVRSAINDLAILGHVLALGAQRLLDDMQRLIEKSLHFAEFAVYEFDKILSAVVR